MRFDAMLTVLRAEMRLTRRLVRYWVFCVLAMVSGLAIFLYYCLLHGFFSSYSATVASIGPRFLIGAMGLYFLGFFLIGLVFLAYDIRARDVRERMVEVLDARPVSTPELVVGRFCAQLLLAWVPAVIMALTMQGLGVILPALGAPIGDTLEPVSIITFTVFMCLPAFAWALGLTYLVTLLVRNRLVAAVVTVAVMVGVIWASFKLPPVWSVFADIAGMYTVQFPSDLLPGTVDLAGLLQRLGTLVGGLGLLAFAIAVHPRLDGGRRSTRAAVGGGLLVAALLMLGGGSFMRSSALSRLDAWLTAHEALADAPRADIIEMDAQVEIDPGGPLRATVELLIGGPDGQTIDPVVLTLNPGLELTSVASDGASIGFEHSEGLVTLDLAVDPDMPKTLQLAFSGEPDMLFGYLDSTRTPERLSAWEAQLFILGYERGINDRRYVALMPGIFWLPAAGTAVSAEAAQGPDYFDLELEVGVPAGWLVAGPGARHDASTTRETAIFSFAPGAPVPGAAVLAARFESFKATIGGIEAELLLSPGHTRNIENLAEAKQGILDRIEDLVSETAEAGFPYPYDGFTMVEAPNALRGFGGGWRLDSVLAQPGMLVVRELGFPLARFDVPFRDPSDWDDREGGVAGGKLERLQEFFINDFSGANLFAAVGRSYFLDQCAAREEGRAAVDWTLDELSTLLLADTRGYFSAHLYTPEMQQNIGKAIQNYFLSNRDGHFAKAVIEVFSSRPAVWQAVLGTSLAEMDPWEDPQRSVDALALKSGALAQALYDDLGFEGTAQLLATLRSAYSGQTFTIDDVVGVVEEVEAGLGSMVSDVITSTDLPGLIGQEAEAFRLADSEDGSPRYQLRVVVRNDERSAGLFRITYYVGDGDDQDREVSDPIRIKGRSAVEWSVVLTRPPTGVWVDPYVALNRTSFRIPMQEVDEEAVSSAEPVEQVVELEWAPPHRESIVVDDQDGGFSVVSEAAGRGTRIGAKSRDDAELDNGLPVEEFGPMPREWSRATSSTAYGRYRHTVAWTRKGKGRTWAEFRAEIPRPGLWDLEVHLPHKQRFRMARTWGTWKLTIVQDGDRREVDFDASAASRGWTLVDAFELAEGEVTVEFSDASSGMIVVADAIRWTPPAARADLEEAP